MGRLRTAVRTLADIDLPPDELLTHLDDVVIRLSAEASHDPETETAGEIGATCLYAVYDPVDGRCSLARAGHLLPAVVSGDGTVDLVDLPPGPPLGLGGLPFEAAEVDLPEGSLLALYTDGLVEGRDRDIDAGLTLLRHALAQPSASLEAACDSVLQALVPTDRPYDDVALLLARPRALGDHQVATWDVDADPAAVARARSNASERLAAWGLEELAFMTELVVSELVTNAIRYGRPPIRLRLIRDRSLLCEVSDAGSTTPHLRRARTFDFWTEIAGLAVEVVGPVPLIGEPTSVQGSVADGHALLTWSHADGTSTVVAYGLRKPVAALRALAATSSPPSP